LEPSQPLIVGKIKEYGSLPSYSDEQQRLSRALRKQRDKAEHEEALPICIFSESTLLSQNPDAFL
jgi:hypothetical protein